MITFEMRKSKALSMPVLVEGIDQRNLKFKLVVEINGVDYGFKAKNEGDTVKFIIPPLDSIVKDLSEGNYNAKLEVSALTEGDRGFFMQPWAEQVRVKKTMTIEVAPIKEEEKTTTIEEQGEKVRLKISSIFSEDNIVEEECSKEKKEDEKKKKNTRLSKALD